MNFDGWNGRPARSVRRPAGWNGRGRRFIGDCRLSRDIAFRSVRRVAGQNRPVACATHERCVNFTHFAEFSRLEKITKCQISVFFQ